FLRIIRNSALGAVLKGRFKHTVWFNFTLIYEKAVGPKTSGFFDCGCAAARERGSSAADLVLVSCENRVRSSYLDLKPAPLARQK
ncbi:MAG: hypothetical protein PHO46_08420, partial [Thermoguttaceae bacterium]|nr:hypothetical protein [Thermoguttaceae bacterium]